MTFASHVEYWHSVKPRLAALLAREHDPAFDAVLEEALALYSFVVEYFSDRVSRNSEEVKKLTAFGVLCQDALRGILEGHRALSPVTLAALTRIALEAHCNLRFITKGPDPKKYADRYFRYRSVETLLHDERRGESLLPPAEVERLRATCPEWIKDGKVRDTKWNAESWSLKDVAERAGLIDEYRQMYSLTSKFVHGTSLVVNIYDGPTGVGAIGQRQSCMQLAFMGTSYCLAVLRDLCEYAGVEVNQRAFFEWAVRAQRACKDFAP